MYNYMMQKDGLCVFVKKQIIRMSYESNSLNTGNPLIPFHSLSTQTLSIRWKDSFLQSVLLHTLQIDLLPPPFLSFISNHITYQIQS